MSVSGSNTPSLARQSSIVAADIRQTVKEYIENLSSSVEMAQQSAASSADSGTLAAGSLAQADDSVATDGITIGGTEEQPQKDVLQLSNESASLSKKLHLHLPPIVDLESYVLNTSAVSTGQASEEHFLNILPDIAEAIASYLKTYPDQVPFVWQHVKPILKDIKRRDRLHGRNLVHPVPPVCAKVPYSWTTEHGDVIDDDYAWLTDKDDPAVMQYLLEENRYADQCLSHTKTLQKVLFKEFVSRLDENAESAKVLLNDGWWYYSRKSSGSEYRLHCRIDNTGYEDVYLDENELSKSIADESESGYAAYFHLGFLKHSIDGDVIAYGIDSSGKERYTAHFSDIENRIVLPDIIPECSEDLEFSSCGKYAFYVKIDEYERAYQIKRHMLGTDVSEDVVLFEETDEMFFVTMTKSCDKRYLIINTAAQVTSETHLLDLSNPLNTPFTLFPRREGVQYTVEHHYFSDADEYTQDLRGFFYVTSNEDSRNIQLFRVPVPDSESWKIKYKDGIQEEHLLELKEQIIANRDFVLIEAFQLRARHLIVFERSNCMQNIRIVNLEIGGGFDVYHYVSFSESSVYSIWPGSVDEEVADLSKSVSFDTNLLRFTYTSFVQPKQVVDYNMDTKFKHVVHEERVLGPGYDRSLYVSKRLWATGTDGTAIPMSIVYRKDLLGLPSGAAYEESSGLGIATKGDGNPTLLHAYGAYGYSISPIFNSSRLSLLDRGFIFAVAHVRGGSEMGNAWYEEGKLAKKPNTFTDFISCAEYLTKEGYTSTEKLAIYGRSAGGLLIGSVVNMRPDLFRSVLTEVPFVDVINTMFDTSIPWTAFEFEEWGNPVDPKIYSIMQSYCPYTNVIQDAVYPNMLVVAGMNDPRVAYFEPAKWTAKLRAMGKWSHHSDNKNIRDGHDRILLLKIQEAGHSGSTGQYAHLEDLAFEYSFLISTLGAQFKPVSSGGKGLSLNGVDYDVYWKELEKEFGDDAEEAYDEEPENYAVDIQVTKPATPLQKFSEFWKRRTAKLREAQVAKSKKFGNGKVKPNAKPIKHSRSGSLKGFIKTLSRGASQQGNEGLGSPNGVEADIYNEEISNDSALNPYEDEARDIPSSDPLDLDDEVTKLSLDNTPAGSKASLRHQLYPLEEEKTTGKGYDFWSKFF